MAVITYGDTVQFCGAAQAGRGAVPGSDKAPGDGIGIYIHIPFCKSKCYYCDFNSYSGAEHLVGPYFEALFAEIALRLPAISERRVKSIYIGGGTPSFVDPDYIARLLEACSKQLEFESNVEISMESNPGTLSPASLKKYKAAGINRLSIGLQAWQDKLLESMGRIHRRRHFIDNFHAACEAGFENINVDLIFGLPGQAFEDWAETLEAVTTLGKSSAGLTHLSCYSLAIEEKTVFGEMMKAGKLDETDDLLDRRMYRHAVEMLAGKGYCHYEISNFALPGFKCRHNLVYWKAGEYAGFGAGAHSFLDDVRFGNKADIVQYIDAVKRLAGGETGLFEDMRVIGRREAMSEFMMLGLRLTEGISPDEFEERFCASLQAEYGDKLEKLIGKGLLECVNDNGIRYRLTRFGLDFANEAFMEFI